MFVQIESSKTNRNIRRNNQSISSSASKLYNNDPSLFSSHSSRCLSMAKRRSSAIKRSKVLALTLISSIERTISDSWIRIVANSSFSSFNCLRSAVVPSSKCKMTNSQYDSDIFVHRWGIYHYCCDRLLTTDKFVHEYIVKAGITTKATHTSTHVNIVISKNTIKHTIMSTESTDNTLKLSVIKIPVHAVFVHI